MPHGGYHGVVKMGGKIIQQGSTSDGQGGQTGGGVYNPDGYETEIAGGSGSGDAQTAAEATAAAEAKKKEIEENFPIQVAAQTGAPSPIKTGLTIGPVGQTTTGTIADVPGFGADDAKNAYKQFQTQNQILNNLLIAQQQAANREGIIRAAQQGVLNASDLTGTTGGLFGLNIPFLGATDTTISGIGSVQNPFTGQELPTQIKAREGLTTPQYNQFIADLYNANPELYQETFPFASGKIAKPLFVKALDAVKGVGSGIAGLPGISELGQIAGDVGSAIVSPLSGLFTSQSTATPQTPGSTYEELLPQGDTQGVDKFGNPVLPMGQYSSVPEEYMQGFMDSPFYKSVAGGAAITYVTLPDGRQIKFGDTGSAAQFRKYLESIGAMQPEKPSGLDAIIPSKSNTGLPALADYASMAPQFTGSQYTNQGVSPAFLENLRKFYG